MEDRAAADALRERVASLESVIASLQVGVLVQSPTSEIVVCNDTAMRLLGLDHDQLVGRTSLDPDWNVVHEDGAPFPGPDHPVPLAIRTRRPVHDVVMGVYRPASRDRVWLIVNADPVFGGDGGVERVICTFFDITERKRAESALRESESLNRCILDAMPGGVVHLAARGVVVQANAEAVRMLGLAPEDVGRVTMSDFGGRTSWEDGTPCPPSSYPAIRCLATGRRQPAATIGVRRADGTTAWGVYAAIPLFEPDTHEVSGAVVTFVDITERKQLEEHLRHVQRVEAVARLAGGVAHHFNNLLTVINGYASLMTKRLDPGDPIAMDAGEIRKAADRASQLTRQLLAFNRRNVVDRRVVDVNTVVSDMRPMLSPLFGELVRFEADLAAKPATVWADPAQVEDIILNLAVNARDAMPRGGSFRLSTRNEERGEVDVRAPDLRPGRYVVLEAADAGVGISADVLAHIFEPFFTTKDVGQGTGLGLSTVHEVVRQSSGTIMVDSEVGQGATFRVYLPEVNASTVVEPSRSARDVRRGRETILVVEDDEAVRTYFRESLMRSGYRVLEASDGADALELSARYPGSISLLVTDVVMPGIGGPELATRLLEERPRMRVLLVSGYAGDDLAMFGVEGAVVDSLHKPCSVDELTHKVRTLLDAP